MCCTDHAQAVRDDWSKHREAQSTVPEPAQLYCVLCIMGSIGVTLVSQFDALESKGHELLLFEDVLSMQFFNKLRPDGCPGVCILSTLANFHNEMPKGLQARWGCYCSLLWASDDAENNMR